MDFQSPEHGINARLVAKALWRGSRDEAGVRRIYASRCITLRLGSAITAKKMCLSTDLWRNTPPPQRSPRANIWQWIHHGVTLDDGQILPNHYSDSWLYQELDTIKHEVGDSRYAAGRFEETADLFLSTFYAKEFAAFLLTLPSYGLLQESS